MDPDLTSDSAAEPQRRRRPGLRRLIGASAREQGPAPPLGSSAQVSARAGDAITASWLPADVHRMPTESDTRPDDWRPPAAGGLTNRRSRAVGAYCHALLPPNPAAVAAADVLSSAEETLSHDQLLSVTRTIAVRHMTTERSRGWRARRRAKPSAEPLTDCGISSLPLPFTSGGELDETRLTALGEHLRQCDRCQLVARMAAAEAAFEAVLVGEPEA
jgi:hypothetical protein